MQLKQSTLRMVSEGAAGKYTMDAKEASGPANLINQLVAVPTHY